MRNSRKVRVVRCLLRGPAGAEVVVIGVVHERFAAVLDYLGLVAGGETRALGKPCVTGFRLEREPMMGLVAAGLCFSALVRALEVNDG
jgi:hypothetical protein